MKTAPFQGSLLVLALALLFEPAIRAQDYSLQAGAPAFTAAQSVELGFINLANGNLHLEIPIASYPERGGGSFTASLIYDSRMWWTTCANAWSPSNLDQACPGSSLRGWRFVTSADRGRNGGWTITHYTCTGPHGGYKNKYTNFAFIFPDGSKKAFAGITTWFYDSNCQMDGGTPVPTGVGYAVDGSGYKLKVTDYSAETVYAPDGTQVGTQYQFPANNPIDINGNYDSRTSLTDATNIDTLGRKPVIVTSSCNGNSNQTCYDVLNSQGITSRWTVTNATIPVNTSFQFGGTLEFSGNITVIQSILQPDGTNYSFGYDSGTTAGHYGEITSITLPTGGQVGYGYSIFAPLQAVKNRWVTSRNSAGGSWTYTPLLVGTCVSSDPICQQQVTVSEPNGDNKVLTFSFYSPCVPSSCTRNGPYLTQSQSYAGAVATANLMATVTSTWNNSSSIQKLSETTTFPMPGGSSISRTQQFTYDSSSDQNLAQVSEWRFYTGSLPATPDRITSATYTAANSSYAAKNILNKPTTVTIKSGTGVQLAQTNYTYDSTPLVNLSGASNHDDTNYGLSNNIRGNPTQISRWVSGSTYLTTVLNYDTTGQLRSVQDPIGNTTNLSYTDNFSTDTGTNPPAAYSPPTLTNAYLTQVTVPIIGTANYNYYYNTGKKASSRDQNGADSYTHYLDSLDRLTHAYGPMLSTGKRPWQLMVYPANSESQLDMYLGIFDSSPTPSCNSCRHDKTLFDGFARVTTQTLANDPDGATNVTTNYDSNGRVSNSSHPFRSTSDSTYGLETPTYDALGRTIRMSHPDNTYSQVIYGSAVAGSGGLTTQLCSSSVYGLGYPTLTIDEVGNKRESWIDGFGSIIELDEPNSLGNLASATCYKRDSLGNLVQTTQGSQTRAYSYDPLSRLISSTTPEAGTTSFYYTAASGSLCSGNATAVCRRTDARNVTTTFSYDSLNRLTGKSYSDSTPPAAYFYDQSTYNGLTIANGKGRRTGMSDGSGTTAWSYDTDGKILTEKRTISGVTKSISYSYNSDGSLSGITYPSGRQVAYVVSNAERFTSAQDVGNGTQYAISAAYAPQGPIQSFTAGKVVGGFGGITETHSFNNRLEITSLQAVSSAMTALNLNFSYNLPGGNNGTIANISNIPDATRSVNFTYDPLNRISSARSQSTSGTNCWGQNFGPDPLANLNSITVAQCSAGTLSVTVDGNNHITNSGYTYDGTGNLSQDGAGNAPTFDAENRITTVAGVTYTYDGNGLRVRKSNGTLYWRSIVGNVIAETDLSGNTVNDYIFFGRRLARRDSSGNVFYYFTDGSGTTRTIANAQGVICYDAEFTPYGQEMTKTNTCPQNYKFTGYERDAETGLDYAISRYYSSRLGRFLSPDPHVGSLPDPQTLNLYGYVRNDPANLTDPAGTDPAKNPSYYAGYYNIYGNPYGRRQCAIDGAFASCSMAFGLIGGGAAAQCPNNNCDGLQLKNVGGGRFVSDPLGIDVFCMGNSCALSYRSIAAPDVAVGMDLWHNSDNCQNCAHIWNGAYNSVKVATAGEATLTGVAFAAPAAVAGAATVTGWGYAAFGSSSGFVVGLYDVYSNYVEAAEARGLGAFNIPPWLYNFFQSTGNAWTANEAYVDMQVFLNRQVYLSGPALATSDTTLWLELNRLSERGVGPSEWILLAH